MTPADWPLANRERLLIVNDPGDLARVVRGRYPQLDISVSPTYLAGVAALADGRPRGVLIGVDPSTRKFEQAVAAIRKAAGSDARVILCCQPSGEPVAQVALAAGADDYLIYPPDPAELDKALDIPSPGALREQPQEVVPTWDELAALAGVLSEMNAGRKPMLDRLCRLIADAMRAPQVTILVDGTSAHAGTCDAEPALAETVMAGGRTLGRILVAPRHHQPYSPNEVEKLRHYGRLAAHLLEAAEQQQHWQSLAMIDEATQLPNRRYLMQALESLLRRASTERFRVTLLIFDLDGFKHFNDAYGHPAGDEVIRETSQLFRRLCRQHDIVARYAGDEFVVVFWDAEEPRIAGSKHPTDALAVLRRVRKALESHEFPRLGPEAVGHITISGGLASYPWDAHDAQSLIERADEALLQAKRAGKNRIFLIGAEGPESESIDDEPASNTQTSSG